MTDQVEDQSLEESFEVEASEDEFSICRKSKIKYTRALLLEFNDKEVCRELPRDFDLLIFRQLSEAPDSWKEHKSISGNSSAHGPLPRIRVDLVSPGERWDNNLLMQGKGSHSQRNCSLERRDALRQQLPQESGYDAGIFGQKTQNSYCFQLSKSENPYRPPHCNKKMQQPSENFSEPGIESSGESDQRGSADNITGNDKSGCGLPLGGTDDSIEKPLRKCEDSWRSNEGNEMNGASETLGQIIEDKQLTFDDFWAEILETIHPQQESLSPTNNHADAPDSHVEIHSHNKDSLISAGHSTIPENFSVIKLEKSDDVANPEAEISLPDEESLISIYDMIAPDSSMPALNSVSLNANTGTSNMALYSKKNSESLNVTKRDDRSMSCKAQSFFDFSGLVTHGKLLSPSSHLPTSADIFGLGNDQMNFIPLFMTPNFVPYIRTPNCFTHSNFQHRSCQANTLTKTKTNDSLVQYSVSQQPNVFPDQQNYLSVDTSCPNPTNQVAAPEMNAMKLLALTSQQATHHDFGKSNAVAQDAAILERFDHDKASGFSFWHTQY